MKKSALCLALGLSLLACKSNRNQEPSPADSAPAASSAAAATPPKKPEGPPPIPAPTDVAAPPANAEKSASGLAWIVLTPGDGKEKPDPEDKVKVHYTGWSKDGTMFDSSVARGQPTSFGLSQVIKGWTEGVGMMTKGEKRRFWIPGSLAYGDTPRRPGAPAGQLTFEVELIDILKAPKAPEDVAAPSAKAKKTKSGLAYLVLTEGKAGGKKPTEKSRVSVHYTGWSKDGKMFDSSVTRGRPASFGLDGVIKGWTEGLQLMSEGAKYRFWIPGPLAYGDTPSRPGAPVGQLTFDVELLEVLGDSGASPGAPKKPAPAAATAEKK